MSKYAHVVKFPQIFFYSCMNSAGPHYSWIPWRDLFWAILQTTVVPQDYVIFVDIFISPILCDMERIFRPTPGSDKWVLRQHKMFRIEGKEFRMKIVKIETCKYMFKCYSSKELIFVLFDREELFLLNQTFTFTTFCKSPWLIR